MTLDVANNMGRNKQKERERKRPAASRQRPDQLFSSAKRSKEDDVEIVEIDQEKPDTIECLTSELSHSSTQASYRKSQTGMYRGTVWRLALAILCIVSYLWYSFFVCLIL